MRYTKFAKAALGALILAGCTTNSERGSLRGEAGEAIPPTTSMVPHDPSWQQFHMIGLSRKLDNMHYYAPDGRVRIEYTSTGEGTEGTWALEPGQLCLQIPVRGRECWPYPRSLRQNETVEITSSLGFKARITMLTDPTGSPLAR